MPFAAAAAGTGGLTAGGAALANVGFAAVIASTAVQVSAQRQEAKVSKDIADANAARLRVQSEQEAQVAAEEQKTIKEEGKRRQSRFRVLAANAGIDPVGTPLLLSTELAGDFEEERLQAGQEGRQRRFGLESAAALEISRGRNIRTASRFRVGTTIATGVGRTTRSLARQR